MVEGLLRQCLDPHRSRQDPAENAVGDHIRDESSVYKAFPGAHVVDISHPQPVQLLRRRLAMYQVRTMIRSFYLQGSIGDSPFALTSYTSHSHQSSDVLTTDIKLLTSANAPHLSHSPGTAIFRMDLADVLCRGSLEQFVGILQMRFSTAQVDNFSSEVFWPRSRMRPSRRDCSFYCRAV